MPRQFRELWGRTPPAVSKPVGVVARTISLYMEDSCGTYAAAIAYYAIFSVVPLALIVLSVFGLVVDREQIVRYVFDQVPLEESASVRESVDEIVRRAQQVSLASLGFGALALVWSASGIFAAVRRGLNAASHRQLNRSYWKGKVVDIALIPSLGMLILASVLLTASVQQVVDRAGELGPFKPHESGAIRITGYVLTAFVSYTMFALLYRYVPSVRPRWPEALTGAAAATLMFEVSKNAYAFILANLPYESDTAIYAGFGTALSFLFWMFINASILLLGAEFIRALRHPELAPQPLPLPEQEPRKLDGTAKVAVAARNRARR